MRYVKDNFCKCLGASHTMLCMDNALPLLGSKVRVMSSKGPAICRFIERTNDVWYVCSEHEWSVAQKGNRPPAGVGFRDKYVVGLVAEAEGGK